MKIGIYPGSFDPITYGHLDIIERASNIFDSLIVVIAINHSKTPMFSKEERLHIIKEVTKHIKKVKVEILDGLLVNFVHKFKNAVIIKGLRTPSDFEYEFQMALLNRVLEKGAETLFMMTSSKYSYISSTMVKEVSAFGGNIEEMVPPFVSLQIAKKRGIL